MASFVALTTRPTGGTGTTDFHGTVPAGVADGDLMLAVVDKISTTGSVTLAGWTALTKFGTDHSTCLFYRIASSDTPGANLNFASSNTSTGRTTVLAFRDVDTGTPFVQFASLGEASATNATSHTVTLATAPGSNGGFVVGGVSNVSGSATTIGTPAGFTELNEDNAQNVSQEVAWKDGYTGAPGALAWTSAAISRVAVWAITFNKAAASTQTVSPSGIASAGTVGSPTVTSRATVSPSGIASSEAFGSPTVTPGAVTVSPSGIASAGAFGTPTVTLDGTIRPTGIPSGEAFGSPTVTPGGVTVSPSGIASAEAFGSPTVTRGAVTISPSGIGSGVAFGSPTVRPGAVTISPSGIASGEAFGTPTVTGGEPPGLPDAPLTGLDWHITGLWDNPPTTVDYFGRIADPIDGEVVIPLNDSRTASVTVSVYDPIVAHVQGFTYAVFLKAYYRSELVFWGPIKLVETDAAAGTARFSAVDSSLRLIHHYLRRGDLNDAFNHANHDRAPITVDAIGLRLLRDAGLNTDSQNTRGVPELGIIDGDNDFTDAPDSLMGVARGDQVWSTMQELSASLGPDFELLPIEDTPGAYCQLNTYTRQGSDTTVQFMWGTGRDNLENFEIVEGSKYTTHVQTLDRGSLYRITPANLTTSRNTGPYVDWDVTDFDAHELTAAEAEAVLLAYGQDVLKAYSVPLTVCTLTLPVEGESDYHYIADFLVGDRVTVSARCGVISLPELVQRIVSVTLKQEGPENATRTELQVVADRTTSEDDEEG